MCECYKIGGPFIDVDPDCPIHNENHRDYQEDQSDVIEQLQAKVAELEEEKKELQALLDFDNARLDQIEDELEDVEYLGPYVEGIKVLKKQLAAEQLNNKLLREALKMVTNKVCWSVFTDSEETQIEESLAQPSDTSALDAYVAEKVKEAGKFDIWKTNPYTKVLETSIKQLTRQRDLAVEELEQRGHSAGCRKNAFGDLCTCGLDETLVAIKESEAK